MRPLRQANAPAPLQPGAPRRSLLRDLAQDLRYAVGMLRKQPGFAAGAILTLALGIGANSAIFALVDATLLRPLPIPEPERVVMISERTAASAHERVSPNNLLDFGERGRSFEVIGGFLGGVGGMVMGGADGMAETVSRQWVTAGVFDALGIQPVVGRTLSQDDDRKRADVVVLSESFWRTRFSADQTLVGRDIRLDGGPYTVVGVVPDSAQLIGKTDLWAMISIHDAPPRARAAHILQAVGRLKPGVTLAAADADLSAVASALAEEYPKTNEGRGVTLEPFDAAVIGADLRQTSHALPRRRRVRAPDLLRQRRQPAAGPRDGAQPGAGASCRARRRPLAAHPAVADGKPRSCRSSAGPWAWRSEPRSFRLRPRSSPRVCCLPLSRSRSTCGSSPSARERRSWSACSSASPRPGRPRRSNPRRRWRRTTARTVGGGGRLRNILVAGEVATAVLLLVGAGLLLRTLLAVQSVDRGYRAESVLTMLVDPLGSEYPTADKLMQFYDAVEQEVRALPGVRSMAWASTLPLGFSYEGPRFVSIVGDPPPQDGKEPSADYQVVSTSYFEAVDLPVVSGRGFDERDTADGVPVCIVNEAFVRAHLAGRSPIGMRVSLRANVESPTAGGTRDRRRRATGQGSPR